MRTILDTPPIPCIVPDGVFDAFSWCSSRTLEWHAPATWSNEARVTVDNPAGMIFVMKSDLPFLPRELACLHVPWLGRAEDWALAPYGIDTATDELYAHDVAPMDALWLAADSVPGVFWGLHDWAHFHSHGPFSERAWTELQCDVTALAWLWLNRRALDLRADRWEAIRRDVEAIVDSRFAADGVIAPQNELLDARRIQGWV